MISLSDAVVAIAATLLVLPVVEIVPDHDVHDVGAVLAENASTFFAMALSFVLIYRFWLVHHRIFARATELSGPLAWLNGVWLLSIVFLPFPTQLIGTQDARDTHTYGLYIGTLLVTNLSGMAIQWHILRTERSRRQGPYEPYRVVLVPGLAFTATMSLALLLVILGPGLGIWALLLLIPAGFAQGRAIRSWSDRSAAP